MQGVLAVLSAVGCSFISCFINEFIVDVVAVCKCILY